jgi:hypothetical protein
MCSILIELWILLNGIPYIHSFIQKINLLYAGLTFSLLFCQIGNIIASTSNFNGIVEYFLAGFILKFSFDLYQRL